MHRRLRLRTETIRQLTARELAQAAGGVPSSFPQCFGAAARSELSERETVGPCPGQYTDTCATG